MPWRMPQDDKGASDASIRLVSFPVSVRLLGHGDQRVPDDRCWFVRDRIAIAVREVSPAVELTANAEEIGRNQIRADYATTVSSGMLRFINIRSNDYSLTSAAQR